MVIAEHINKYFQTLHALKDVSLEIARKEVVSIVGKSGVGKTTLLQILGSLLTPDSGKVFINGKNVFSLSGNKLAQFRNEELGFVFQFHNLLPEFTALENTILPQLIAGKSKRQAKIKGMELLDFFGLQDRADHRPSELSGGEQQRIAIARAIINNPALLLADEPSGNLDTANANTLHQCFFDLRDNYNQTIIIVTHNQQLANQTDRIITMADGQILL